MIVKKEAQRIALTTLEQLGGHGKLKAMIGARKISHDNEGTLFFTFSGSRKANEVRIILTPTDTYDMNFYKNGKHKEEYNDIYSDKLKPVFEESTGLYISL